MLDLLVEEGVLAVGSVPVRAVVPGALHVLQAVCGEAVSLVTRDGELASLQTSLRDAMVCSVGAGVPVVQQEAGAPLETFHTGGQEVTGVQTGGAVVAVFSLPPVITVTLPALTDPVSPAHPPVTRGKTLRQRLLTVAGRARPPGLALADTAVTEPVVPAQ